MTYFRGRWLNRRPNVENRNRFLGCLAPGETFCLYDLGASGGTPPPFLFLGTDIDIVNFEPDRRNMLDGPQKNLSVAIGPENYNTIYLNRRPTTSSLLPPNKQVTDRYDWSKIFGNDDDIFETVSTEQVDVCPLDQAQSKFKVNKPDFLKIDVQGLTFEVLEGARKTIDESVLGIETEVEFLESYIGQKTFGVVHELLYEKGFEIFRLKNLNPWYYKSRLSVQKYTGQDVFCDLVYFRNIGSIKSNAEFWTETKAIKMVLLLLLYDLPDAAAAYHEEFVKQNILEANPAFCTLIGSWKDSVDFFYHKHLKARMRSVLSTSPLDVIRFFRSHLRRFK